MENTLKIKYLKKAINDKKYTLKRISLIEDKIYQWKASHDRATTSMEKECCNKMMTMYVKRLIYYLNKN